MEPNMVYGWAAGKNSCSPSSKLLATTTTPPASKPSVRSGKTHRSLKRHGASESRIHLVAGRSLGPPPASPPPGTTPGQQQEHSKLRPGGQKRSVSLDRATTVVAY